MIMGDVKGSSGGGWMVNEMIEDAISDRSSNVLHKYKNNNKMIERF